MRKFAKVFDISLPRTGTRSLTVAMARLGYTTWHGGSRRTETAWIDSVIQGTVASSSIVRRFDFLSHVGPWVWNLAKAYPDAGFILLNRDKESWLTSCAKHWGKRYPRWKCAGTIVNGCLQIPVYRMSSMTHFVGCLEYNRLMFEAVWEQFHIVVYKELKQRGIAIVRFDLREGWKPLCRFLGHDVPSDKFPQLGTSHKFKRDGLVRIEWPKPLSAEQWRAKYAEYI